MRGQSRPRPYDFVNSVPPTASERANRMIDWVKMQTHWAEWAITEIGGPPGRQTAAVAAALASLAEHRSPEIAAGAARQAAQDWDGQQAPLGVARAIPPASSAYRVRAGSGESGSWVDPANVTDPRPTADVAPFPPPDSQGPGHSGSSRTSFAARHLELVIAAGLVVLVVGIGTFAGWSLLAGSRASSRSSTTASPASSSASASPSATGAGATGAGPGSAGGGFPQGPVVYSNALSTEGSGWAAHPAGYTITKFESGGYSMSLAGITEQWATTQAVPTGAAIEVEVTASVLRGDLKAAGGPACLSADGVSYYSFVVDDAGSYLVYGHLGGSDQPAIVHKPTPAARTGRLATNRVAAACISQRLGGTRLMMSINGSTVFDSVDLSGFSGPWRGAIAICTCHGGGDVLFQNLVEQRLPDAP